MEKNVHTFNEEKTSELINNNSTLNHYLVVVGLFDKKSKITKHFRQYNIHIAAEDEGEANEMAFFFCEDHIGILDNEYFDIVENAILI